MSSMAYFNLAPLQPTGISTCQMELKWTRIGHNLLIQPSRLLRIGCDVLSCALYGRSANFALQ